MIRTCTVLCATLAVACAPMSTSRRFKDVSRPDKVSRGTPEKGTATLTVTAAPDGYIVSSADTLVCREQRAKVVARTEIRTRKVNKPFTVFEYVLGVVVAAPSAFAIAAPDDAISTTGLPLTTEQMRTSGAIGAGVGGFFLLFGVINSFRGGTTSKDIGLVETPQPAGAAVACGSKPRTDDPIVLAVNGKNVPVGTIDADGGLKITFDALAADLFEGDWKAAQLVSPGATVAIDLTPARAAVAQREFTALAAAPTLETARGFRARFGRDDKIDALLVQLADAAYAPQVSQALDTGDLEKSKAALALWSADAPDSAMLVASRAEVGELERLGPVEYLHAKFVAASATANADPKRYADAERALLALVKIAPNDARVAPADKALKAHKKALIALANKRVDQAKAHADKKQWLEVEVELGKARDLAFDDKATLARIQRVEAKRPAGTVAVAVPPTTETTPAITTPGDDKARAAADAKAAREEKARLAAEAKAKAAEEAKAKRDEKARLAAEAKAKRDEEAAIAKAKTAEEKARIAEEAKAKRDEKARLAAEAKAKAEEEAKAKRDEKARLAAEAKAKAEEEKARIAEEAKAKREEQERLAAEAKAKAAEEQARIASERARTAEEKKAAEAQKRAAAAETARLAAEERARKQAEQKKAAEAARLAAAAERARKKEEAARAKQGGAAPATATVSATGMTGLWAAVLGTSIWLLELDAGGTGKTALFSGGRVVAMRDVRWQLDKGSLSVAAGSSTIRGHAAQNAATLGWLGVAWTRQ